MAVQYFSLQKLLTSLFLGFLTLVSTSGSIGVNAIQDPSSPSSPQHHHHQPVIHQQMSQHDLRNFFQVQSHEEVPEYDVVHLRVITKRSAEKPEDHKQVYLKAFGQDLHLNLRPNNEFNSKLKSMKVFAAESSNDGRLKYVEESSDLESLGRTYHDDQNMAAVVVRRSSDGNFLMDGTIGNDWVIKPVPSHIASASSSSFSSSSPPPSSSSDWDPSRDDDEMFLEEDDVSVSELNHLKKKSKKEKKKKAFLEQQESQRRQQEKHHLHHHNNNKSNREGYDEVLTSAVEEQEPGFNLTTSLHPQQQPNTRIPKHEELSKDQSKKHHHHSDSLYHKHAHFVFKKKLHDIRPEPHHDFAPLEPGHLPVQSSSVSSSDPYSSFNWTLVPSTSSQSFTSLLLSANSSSPVHRRSKRQSPDTVWPEVLLVVDYDSYLLHGGNSRDVKRYFISFWNGVDLRYKLLSHPRIRVSLAGMIVAKDRDATPYLERNRLRAPNADAVDAAGALTDMGKYLYREDRLPTYDLAVVITKLDMCRRRYEGGRCNRGTAGFAYVGGACVVNKRLEKVNSVAIIEDSGGFSGIIVAAHEVGHLLGCVHDGSPPPSYLGGPGATRCPWEDGFIMSDLRHTERGFRWSSCSVEQFKHFLNGETATCLYNYPHENQLLPRVLPGTMLTLDEQCKRDRGTNACFKDARVCAQLFCFDSASGYCVSYRPAAEGSSCGDGQVCRNGKCTAELENIIPDYTHVTQTVVSRGQPDRLLSRSDNSFGTSVAPLPPAALQDNPETIVVHDLTLNRGENRRDRIRGRSFRGDDDNLPSVLSSHPTSSSSSSSQRKKSSSCRDIIEKMAGSLSCSDFLERFGYRYCNHSYVKRNCCASHAIICNKTAK